MTSISGGSNAVVRSVDQKATAAGSPKRHLPRRAPRTCLSPGSATPYRPTVGCRVTAASFFSAIVLTLGSCTPDCAPTDPPSVLMRPYGVDVPRYLRY